MQKIGNSFRRQKSNLFCLSCAASSRMGCHCLPRFSFETRNDLINFVTFTGYLESYTIAVYMDKKQIQALVKKAQAGDEEAYTQLVHLYSDRVYNLALRILRRSDDAADITQETFIKVLEKIDSFDGRSDFFTWIYRITTNLSLMKLRKDKRTVLTDDDLEKYFDRPNYVEIEEWQARPLENMLSEEFREHLNRAVDSLPEIYRSVFILRDLENLSIRESSKVLGITETNVKVRLKRARMFLRDKLAEYMNEQMTTKA